MSQKSGYQQMSVRVLGKVTSPVTSLYYFPSPTVRPSTPSAAERAPVEYASSFIEQTRTALADSLRRFKQVGKRPTRKQAHQWCCSHGYALAAIRFKTEVWPYSCDLAGVPEWKKGGRISGEETVSDSEIEEP